ncbi:MAG: LytTR family DNA-binding domain-containing protein [Lachnospiraceae bacterium]|nr:LytTR family DNA-binding domain-containing protein [Lachnospiraceae bacterium]
MHRIIICDDELQIGQLVQRKLIEYGMRRDIEIKTTIFTDAANMLRALPEQADLIFLDVEMPNMDGITAAAEVRKKLPDVNIIFLSGHKEYVFETFRVQAFRYLLKPLKEEELEEALDAIIVLRNHEERLEYRFQDENWSIPYRSIVYFEGMRGKIWIYCTGGKTYRWRGAMGEIAEKMKGRGFVMVHQSYVINMKKIHRYNSREIEMEGGAKIPISRLRLNDFKREYIKIIGGAVI